MTQFRWVDGNGVSQLIDSPYLIDAEAEANERAIRQAAANLKLAPSDQVQAYRAKIRQLEARRVQLAHDAKHWNDCASKEIKIKADVLMQEIIAFTEDSKHAMIVAKLNKENAVAFGAGDLRAAILSEAMTDWQQLAIKRSSILTKPSENATRLEAYEWLNNDPMFFRPESDENGWFQWTDDEGVIQHLQSPLRIELEIFKLAEELDQLVPGLMSDNDVNAMSRALEATNPIIERISVLQYDLERFGKQATLREDEEWEVYLEHWSSPM